MAEITKSFWLPLLAAIIGSIIVWYLIAGIKQSRKASQEKRVYKFLKNNTTDKAGQQFLPISLVSTKLNIGTSAVLAIVHDSPRIHICPSHKDSIGIYQTERSVYEERGVITI